MPEPSVRDLLLADLDELLAAVTRALDKIGEVTDQLTPDRANACRSAIAVVRAGLFELHDRAHAQPTNQEDNQ